MNVQAHSGSGGPLALDPGSLTPCPVLLWSLRRLSGSLALQHQLSSGFPRPDKPPFSLSLPPTHPPQGYQEDPIQGCPDRDQCLVV